MGEWIEVVGDRNGWMVWRVLVGVVHLLEFGDIKLDGFA